MLKYLLSTVDRHVVQDLVKKLQSTMKVNFYPAGRIFYRLTGVVGTPAFDKAQPKDAQTAEIVNTDAGSSGEVCQEYSN